MIKQLLEVLLSEDLFILKLKKISAKESSIGQFFDTLNFSYHFIFNHFLRSKIHVQYWE